MKRKHWIFLIFLIGGGVGYFYWEKDESTVTIKVEAKTQDLVISVSTTGELEAESTVDIMGPVDLRRAHLWETKITKIIPEGTIIKKGDFVAELDVSQLDDRIKQKAEEIEKRQAVYEQVKLDTALNLSEYRDRLINLEYAVEEKKIRLEQSAFEPPATIKQAEMDVDKAERTLNFARRNYQAKLYQNRRKVEREEEYIQRMTDDFDFLQKLLPKMTIYAPDDGMMIYIKERSGIKRKEGSKIHANWPGVATLPDLSSMISRTYINEVDIRKISVGQTVEIGLDAFPDKAYTGTVQSIANVGEQRPNSDAKVFEVMILINGADYVMRPAMTTSNKIITKVRKDVLCIPIEALRSQGDTLSYVFRHEGDTDKKILVKTGDMNDQFVEVVEGIDEGDILLLSDPEETSETLVMDEEE